MKFRSIWGRRLPELFITIFSQTKQKKKKRGVNGVWNVPGEGGAVVLRERRKVDCVHADVLSMLLCPHYFRVDGLFRSGVFIPAYIHNCGCKQKSNAPFGSAPQTPESLNCASGLPYIKINSLCDRGKRPWSARSTSPLPAASHTFLATFPMVTLVSPAST